MCGICGVVARDSSGPIDGPMLERMTDILRHRGPDGRGFLRAPGVGLGVQRLSIVDLETGDQPIAGEDGTVTLVCNGEIYNSPELRTELEGRGHRFRTRSDVEVIVHLYEEQGVECLHRLRGMFAFALWDGPRRRVMLARDRLGIKPLHYAVGPDGLYFGSELKAILESGRIAREVDVHALDDLFTLGFVVAPRTLFKTIRRLLPGEYLLYAEGVVSTHRYWHPRFPPRGAPLPGRSAHEWAECLRAKLDECVRIHLRSDVPVGTWLSAGVDSSGITSLARRATGGPLQTFTLGFEDPAYDEVGHQKTLDQFPGYDLVNERAVCGANSFELYPKALWHTEDPSAAGIEIPRLILSEASARRVKVVLTGEGADEIFGGYPWFRWDRLLRPLAALPLPVRRLMLLGSLIPTWQPRGSRVLMAPRTMSLTRYRHLIGPVREDAHEAILSPAVRLGAGPGQDGPWLADGEIRDWTSFAQLQHYEMTVRMPDFVVHTLDRLSMAHGLEARVPFLDHELVELCAQIPPRLKLRGSQEKYILRQALRGALPPEILGRNKRGLQAPVRGWLRGPLPPFAEDLLSPDRLRDKGYFAPDAVRALLEGYRRQTGPAEGPSLLSVLAIQLWDELFVRGRGPLAS
jgi:asparagine synthase (glutamine-hydrolysing)